jgi:hypothetical protein
VDVVDMLQGLPRERLNSTPVSADIVEVVREQSFSEP